MLTFWKPKLKLERHSLASTGSEIETSVDVKIEHGDISAAQVESEKLRLA